MGISRTTWGPLVIIGGIWGVSEAGLGMVLQRCASSISGSAMTGVALFFLAAGWAVSRRAASIGLMVAVVSLFKLFDAWLLGLPVLHGAVANPIFAFLMEGAAFLLLASMIRKDLADKAVGRGFQGGLAALLAVNLFPLVRYATGIAACVVPGTSYPMSLYYGPIAIGLSIVTVPLGYLGGEWIAKQVPRSAALPAPLLRWLTPAVLALCLAFVVLLRTI